MLMLPPVPQLVIDYLIVYASLAALRPVGLFRPDGSPRAWGTGPEDTPIPPWLLAVIIAIRLAA